ncbi:hypothetical protein BDZ45DRAFT_802213 [Acephala macrosclerotiorum]|nr:hypothetical protein BDZ45DRAFT_802213 [Acephala macrosclerotiorum]
MITDFNLESLGATGAMLSILEDSNKSQEESEFESQDVDHSKHTVNDELRNVPRTDNDSSPASHQDEPSLSAELHSTSPIINECSSGAVVGASLPTTGTRGRSYAQHVANIKGELQAVLGYLASGQQLPSTQTEKLARSALSAIEYLKRELLATKSFPWDKCPYEIRELIFAELDNNGKRDNGRSYFRWNYNGRGEIPPLVVALRSFPSSHDHALQWFRKCNFDGFLMMDSKTGYDLGTANLEELSVFTSIQITLETPNCITNPDYISTRDRNFGSRDDLITRPLEKVTKFAGQFLHAHNIKRVYLSLNDWFIHPQDLVYFITEFPLWLQGFRYVKSVSLYVPRIPNLVSDDLRREVLVALLNKIDEKIGVMGEHYTPEDKEFKYNPAGYVEPPWDEEEEEEKSEDEGSENEHEVGEEGGAGIDENEVKLVSGKMEHWYWEVDDGQVMDWSQDLGCRMAWE